MSSWGRFSGRHEGGLISLLLTHSAFSALCDALPERESTALGGEVWHKAGKYLSGPQPSCCPNLSPGAGSSPTFSFPLAVRLFKVESIESKSNHVQILKDGACSLQPVYIAFHDDLLLSLTAYFVCFLVSGQLIVN